MSCAQLGRLPDGDRLEQIKKSPNYRDGSFRNLIETPLMTEESSMAKNLWDFFIRKNDRSKPENKIPSKKTNLKTLGENENVLVWFGHSSYFMQIAGKRFLIDPVFSGHASPFPFMIKSFEGTDVYTEDDIPEIDYLIITHDHYDHLDHQTVTRLNDKIKKIICGLGVGSYFEHWGVDKNRIVEKDWNETFDLGQGFFITTLPARHFSGRSFYSNQTLWASYALKTPSINIYLGGDSGYGPHFKFIGEKYGPFDLAILENGQYNEGWKYIHMMPEETLEAAKEVKAKRLFPVHSAKFALSKHAWDAPLKRLSELDKESHLMISPMIGEKVNLNDEKQIFIKWWEGIDK